MRLFLTVVLPLLLPTLLFLAWLALRARRGTAPGAPAQPPPPWGWLAGGGAVLLALSLGLWRLSEGAPPGADYVPARLENGRIVDGEMVRPR